MQIGAMGGRDVCMQLIRSLPGCGREDEYAYIELCGERRNKDGLAVGMCIWGLADRWGGGVWGR